MKDERSDGAFRVRDGKSATSRRYKETVNLRWTERIITINTFNTTNDTDTVFRYV